MLKDLQTLSPPLSTFSGEAEAQTVRWDLLPRSQQQASED